MLQLSYVVSHASWLPQYDYRVDSKSAVAQLTYYGIIKNSTGEDWNDVLVQFLWQLIFMQIKLSLSTASPDVIGAPADLPTLQVQQRTYEKPRFRGSIAKMFSSMTCVREYFALSFGISFGIPFVQRWRFS